VWFHCTCTTKSQFHCSICGGAHESGCCITLDAAAKEVNYMGNQHKPGFNAGGFTGYQQGANFNQNQEQ